MSKDIFEEFPFIITRTAQKEGIRYQFNLIGTNKGYFIFTKEQLAERLKGMLEVLEKEK